MGRVQTIALAIMLAPICVAAPLNAEVLPVSGIYPANSDAAITIESIAVETLDGTQGAPVQFELKKSLDAVTIDDSAWFRIMDTDDAAAQAIITGSVGHQATKDQLDDKEVVSCLEKDSKDKCLRRRTTYVPCHKLSVQLFPDLKMVDPAGQELWRFVDRKSRTEEYCEDDSDIPSSSEMLDRLHSSLAWQIRRELAPIERSQEVRILEKRKGLVKDDRSAFKDAVRMTKHDPLASCIGFEALEVQNPEQTSVLYNIGLCKENAGDLKSAENYYNRAVALQGSKYYTTEGLERISERRAANEQLAIRFGGFRTTQEAMALDQNEGEVEAN